MACSFDLLETDCHLLQGWTNPDGHRFWDDYEVETFVTRWPIMKDTDFFQKGIERLVL